MSYRRAETVLPLEIIELIQCYVDGENIYIPRKAGERKTWGKQTRIKQELQERNQSIWKEYQNGIRSAELAVKYCLSVKSIQRIVAKMRCIK